MAASTSGETARARPCSTLLDLGQRPNHVWALDFIFDATSYGRPLKALAMCDEFTHTYNHHRPHSALGYMTPAMFAAAWTSGKSITPNLSPWNGLRRPG